MDSRDEWAAGPDGGFVQVDELEASRAAAPTPDRETADGRDAASARFRKARSRSGSLVFADELPDGVVVADEVGRVIVFNRAAAA